jgi:gamma-tubulin complex component 3
MAARPPTSQQAQLLQILLRALNTPPDEESALLGRAVDTVGKLRRNGDTSSLDTAAGAMEAVLAPYPDRLARFHVLRRRLAFAGQVGSGMAGYSFKPELLQLLLALQRAQPHLTASFFTDSGPPAAPQPGHAARVQQADVSVELLSEAGAIPPWIEAALVRDLVYVFQGVDGTHVRLDSAANAFVVSSVVDGFQMPFGVRCIVSRLSELGWMHRRILRGLKSSTHVITKSEPSYGAAKSDSSEGLVRRAFAAAVRSELGDFYRLLAELDASTAAAFPTVITGGSPTHTPHSPPWTLRRLLVWAAEPMLRMKCLAVLVDACEGLGGASIASQLHLHHVRGDPSTSSLVGRILGRACKPLVSMCLQWMATGRVHGATTTPVESLTEGSATAAQASDPHTAASFTAAEFFVRSAPSPGAVEDLWDRRFSIDPAAVPIFWSAATAEAVLAVGKSVHFMIAACNDTAWVAKHVQPAMDAVKVMMSAAAAAAAASGSNARRGGQVAIALALPAASLVPESLSRAQATLAELEGTDVTETRLLEATLEVLQPLVDARLAELILVSHRLESHLQAIQRYILLGQGDFVSVLLSTVSSELDRPASAVALSLPTLDGALEASIRASNAQHDEKDMLARICVRLLTPSPGDVGWDIFTLQYAMTAPLSAIVTPAAAESYARLFYFLWRIRRVEHALSGTWTAHMAAAHSVRALGHPGLIRVLHTCNLLRAELTSFVTTLISYLMFEVVAAAWQGLQVTQGLELRTWRWI